MVAARRRAHLLLAAALTLTACSAPSTPPVTTTADGQRLLWSDEFDGKAGQPADPDAWKTKTGGTGWGNQELECYTAARGNSALDGHGDLVITALKQPGHVCSDGSHNDYTSARLSSKDLRTVSYGRIAVRAKMPTGLGIWPAFWALGDDHDIVGWPTSGEIDVSEVLGRLPTQTHGSLHGPEPTGQPYDISAAYNTGARLSDDFHVYAADWTSQQISFSIDNHVYFTVTKADVQKQGAWVFDHPFYLLLNVAVGGSWPGNPDSTTTWPQTMTVDWVRVYAN